MGGEGLDGREDLGISGRPQGGAARMYRENYDGCRDLWKENYRKRKAGRAKG
jgi:hypothetical protein